LTEKSHFVFGLHQEDERNFGVQCKIFINDNYRYYALFRTLNCNIEAK